MARTPFVDRAILEPLIRERRAQRRTWKEIAKEVGHYHPVYLAYLGATWNRDSIYCAKSVDGEKADL